jgi:hypothetical protein
MAANPNYAAFPRIMSATVQTANAARDGTGTLATLGLAGTLGTLIDTINITGTTSTTAGSVRIFRTPGTVGVTIGTLSFAGTVATVTTTGTNHGLTTGNLVYTDGQIPADYRVLGATLTVTGAQSFTYPMATTPTTNAVQLGYYATTAATPTNRYYDELPIAPVTVATNIPPGGGALGGVSGASVPQFNQKYPIKLPPGWLLRASTVNAETFIVEANGGDN